MNLNTFSITKGNLEVRSCNYMLLSDGDHSRAEIVAWEDKHCYTIASWEYSKEVYELCFVGRRPFDSAINPNDFVYLCKIGQDILDYQFEEAKKLIDN